MAENSADSTPSEAASTPRQDDSSSGNNWWDSWIASAKTKSAEVYTMVKKDLDEIGSAVKSEASHVLSSTSTVIGKTFKFDEPESPANMMKKSLSSFIGQVSTVLSPEPDDEDDTEVILSSGDTTMLSTYKKELEALQRVDATFLVPADGPELEAWRASLEREPGAPAAAARRLASSPALRAQYERLVPDAVPHHDFWERYLFRVALLQDRLAAASRKQPLEEPTTDPVLAHLPLQTPIIVESPKKTLSGLEAVEEPITIKESSSDIDGTVAWEDEDFANDVELTEEQQTLLLEEYEKEIASKKVTKQTSSHIVYSNKTTSTTVDTKSDQTQTRVKTNKSTDKKKNARSPKKAAKSDVCGKNLVEDYFADKEQKDDASANSDESWEKEFEIEDVTNKKA